MATTFYPRNANIGITTYNRFAAMQRGTTVTRISGTTTASGTWISLGYFSSRPLTAFTLSGSVSFNLWGSEASNNDNCTVGMRVYKLANNVLSASLGQASNTTEFLTSAAVRTASVTPTSTAFAAGDILVFEIGLINVGTMGSGTGFLNFDGPTSAANGDSYITITENIEIQKRFRTTT